MCLFSYNKKSGGEPCGAGAAAQNVLKDAISFSLSAPASLMCGLYSHSQHVADPPLDLTPTFQVEEKECRGLCVHPASAPTSLYLFSSSASISKSEILQTKRTLVVFFFPEGADAQFDIGEMGFGFPFRVLVRRNQGGGLPWLQKLPQGLPGFLLYKAWK